MSLGAALRARGLWADKRLGQHFLLDPSILRKIATAAGDLASATVLEVGPGPGGLTEALLTAGAARVVAVERDPRFVEHLQELRASHPDRLRLTEADALDLDLAELATPEAPLTIVANLPYNVATPLLLGWLERLDRVAVMVLMFQKEVALRLAAWPGTSDYGRLAVMAQACARVERLFDLPPSAFTPPPKVSSSVVRLTPLPDRPSEPVRRALAEVTRAAFGQRRKMLRSSLKALGRDHLPLLAACGINPSRRAEELSLREFLAVAERVAAA